MIRRKLWNLKPRFVIVLLLIGRFSSPASSSVSSSWRTAHRNFLAHSEALGFRPSVQMMGPLGYLVTIGEFFGGLGLIFGFLSRFSAASIILIMLGAIGMVHSQFGFFMNWTGKQAGEGFEYHLLVIGTLLPILIAGPGRFAIGQLLPLPKAAGKERVITVLE